MISKVILRNFKLFKEETFELDANIVFAGQNNSGKTTVIQAIAAWSFALQEWMNSGHNHRSVGLTRKEFTPVPLHEFNQLWHDKATGFKRDEVQGKSQGTPRALEIEIHGQHEGEPWQLTMEFKYTNKDQVYVKPSVGRGKIPAGAEQLKVAYIPSFSGISVDEPEHNRAYQDYVIGQGKPGDILRNLLLEVSETKEKWESLIAHIKNIFNYELVRPSSRGKAFIVCEYRRAIAGRARSRLEINTAGSGFQQTLLLLAFLYARPATVLMMDEPDAHLHFNLQSEIYRRIKNIVDERKGQLIIATHSEVLINATDPQDIVSFLGEHPHRLSDSHQRKQLQKAIKHLSAVDMIKAEQSGNRALFLEAQSDFDCLRAWAKVLEHPARPWFESHNNATENTVAYWWDMHGKRPQEAREHFSALQAAFPEMKGFVLIDRNNEPDKKYGFDKQHPNLVLKMWHRYETESYLVHKDSIRRFIASKTSDERLLTSAMKEMENIIPPEIYRNSLQDNAGYFEGIKPSESILPRVLKVVGLRLSKSDYHKIAEVMNPEEVHADVRDMLDAIAGHFDLPRK